VVTVHSREIRAAVEAPTSPSRRWSGRLWRWVTVALVLVIAVALARALTDQDWSVLAVLLRERDHPQVTLLLAAALLTMMTGPGLALLAWRRILFESGPPVSLIRVVRVFFVVYFVKYVPGKVPGVLAAARAATANGLTVSRALLTSALGMLLTGVTGLSVGLLAGGQVLGGHTVWLVLAAAPVILVVGRPGVLRWVARAAARLVRRPELGWPMADRAVRAAVAWQTLAWLVSGLHLWLLAVAMGADPARALPLCVGVFGVASVVGVGAVVVPDGLGVREALISGALALVLPVPSAVAVAVASRLVVTVGEVVVGGAALAAAEVIRRWCSRASVDTAEVALHKGPGQRALDKVALDKGDEH
jgi:hypothetical protein